MSEARNTIIQQNFPSIRRKSLTNLTTLIKHTASFITHLAQDSHHHPRPTLKESEDAIASHFQRMHYIIDTVDDHITRRLENHQNEVFSLVKMEIEEMREETRKIVEKLNAAIAEKNTEDQIWNLNNELDYFKSQTYQLFKENKKAKQDSASLKQTLREMEVELENSRLVMHKLRKQYLKEAMIKDKIVALVKQSISTKTAHQLTMEQINQMLSIQKVRPSSRIKTQPASQPTPTQFFQSRVQVKLNSAQKQSKVVIHLNNHSLHDQSSAEPHQQQKAKSPSILSSLNQQSESSLHELPPVQFVKVESQLDPVPQLISFKMPKKMERGVQTEAFAQDKGEVGKPPLKQNAAKMFSNTSYIQVQGRSKQKKKLDLTKNGFFVRSYNQKIDRLATKTENVSCIGLQKQSRQMRYLSKAMNKSKMDASAPEARGTINKSSLK